MTRRSLVTAAATVLLLAPVAAAQDEEPGSDESPWDEVGDVALDIMGDLLRQALHEWTAAAAPPMTYRAATAAEWDRAEALAAAAGMGLRRVEGLDQPARQHPFAGQALPAEGVEVDLEGDLELRRLRFAGAAAAAAYAEDTLRGALARVAGDTVTTLEGVGATRALLDALVTACDAEVEPPPGLAAGGRRERSRRPLTVSHRVPHDVPAASGWCLDATDGTLLRRLRFVDATAARDFAGRYLDPLAGAELVADARGRDLLLVRPRPDAAPADVARLLEAAWRVEPPTGPRAGLAVIAEQGARRAYLALGSTGALHERAAKEVLDRRRQANSRLEGDHRWRFLDAETLNDVQFRFRGTVWGQATLLDGGALLAVGRDKDDLERARARLLDLARALDVTLPPRAARRVEGR